MVAQFDKDQQYLEKLMERRRREGALDRQQEIEREFMLTQIDELAADFAEHPEQIGHYIADLEAAGMLGVADRGMLFRRLWETMGPSFADRAFNMTERALAESDALARDISDDVAREHGDQRRAFDADREAREVDADERRELDVASEALLSLSRALGLNLRLAPAPEPVTTFATGDDRVVDPDAERAGKTRELLDVLGPQLGVDTRELEVKVDDEARYQTALQGLYGLMADGTVFLNPDVYDPETSEGRGLLAHEVSHIAQRENTLRGAAQIEPSIVNAEREADQISEMFAQGGAVEAPLASLAMYDQAACGPRAMQEKPPEEPKEPTTEVIVEPPRYEIIEDTIVVPDINFPFDEPGRALQGAAAIDASGYGEQNGPILRRLIETVASYPEITGITIKSHTDHRGAEDYNKALSDRRAKATMEWLRAPTDGGGALQINKIEATGLGEKEPKNPSGFHDGRDLNEAQHRENRRSEFKITEVNGKPHTGPFKPTKRILVQPGRTIIRYLDEDGNVIKEEIVVDGQQPVGLTPEEQGGAAGGGGGGGAAPGGGGGGAPAGGPAIPPSTQSPLPKVPGGTVYSQSEKVDTGKSVRVAYRYASPSILGRVPQPTIHGVAQAKAGTGGLKSGTIAERTRAAGGGEPLPGPLLERFESAFGQSFGDVRIHRASTAATSVGATAFARGSDIHFAPGRFDAGSQSGLDVLGHELTHIVQQRSGRVSVPQNKGANVNVDRALEAEADLLGSRAARGERVSVGGSAAALYGRGDTVQYEGGEGEGGAEQAEAAPTNAEIYIGGQKISARMPSGASPGAVRVDFEGAEYHGVRLGSASLTFDDAWKIQSGTVQASVAIGEYVQADDIELRVERRTVGREEQAHVAANIRGAQLNISELFDTTIDLTIGSDGVSGRAQIDASAPITLGGGVTLTSGSLTVTLSSEGTLGASGTLVGTIEGIGEVTITANAFTDGHLSGGISLNVTEALTIPGVEGVTIESASISGEYVHGQSWSVTGNVKANVRDWVGADITATYTHQSGGGEGDAGGGEAASSWELRGILTQLQAYTVGEGALTLENGELDLAFKDGAFEKAKAKVDYDTPNWKGKVEVDYNVAEQELDGEGTIELKDEQLPIGDTGGKLTAANAKVTVVKNVLTELNGAATAVFLYQEQETFELKGEDVKVKVPEGKLSGSATVTTLRQLDFGDKAAYNANVKEGATATLTVADNKLEGITGGLAFDVLHGEGKIGEGTVDVSFEGETNALNANAKFTLTDENGFGVPDRLEGPVKLLPGGTFELAIEGSELALAQVKNVKYEIKQGEKGGTGVFAGEVNGSYEFKSSKLNVEGNGELKEDWPLVPNEGINLTFTKGGKLDITVAESKLTSVSGDFPFACTVDAKDKVPQLVFDGELKGDYSDETKQFSGELNATLKDDIVIPMGEKGADQLTVKKDATVKATVASSKPGTLDLAFAAEYQRAGEDFLHGRVEKASYDFGKGEFDFKGDLTLKKKIEKQTEDGKWKFVIQEGATVGVEVEKSKLKMLTGSIPFEVHDATDILLKGNLNNAEIDVEKLEFSGDLDVALGRDLQYPRGEDGSEKAPEGEPPVSIVAKKDVSKVWGKVSKNTFVEVGGALHFGVNLGGEEYGAGEITGTWNMVANQFSGEGKITLVKDLLLGGTERSPDTNDPVATWILAFQQGQGLDIKVKNNVLDEANIDLGCKLFHNLEEVANGSVSGLYKLGETEKFKGTAQINVIKNLDWSQDDRFHYWVEEGTSAKVTVEGIKVTAASGDFRLLMQENNADAVRVTFNGSYTPGTGFEATGEVEALDNILIGESAPYSLFVAKDSSGKAGVKGLTVDNFSGDLTLLLKKGEGDFAKGVFNIDYKLSEGANAVVNAEGRVELVGRQEITPEGGAGDFKVFLTEGTGVGAKITTGELDWLDGTVNGEIFYKGPQLAKFNLTGKYQALGTPDFTANGSLETVAPAQIIEHEGWVLYLDTGANIAGSVKAFELEKLTANIPLSVHKPAGTEVIKATLAGEYVHATPSFTGKGSAQVVKSITVAENVGDKGYSFYVEPGTEANAKFTNNTLDELGGTLVVTVGDAPGDAGKFLKATAQATYTQAEGGQVTASGKLEVTRRKKLVDTAAGYAAILDLGSEASITLTNNNVDKIGGVIKVAIEKPEGTKFAWVQLSGEYTEAAGFDGKGEAGLEAEYRIIETKFGDDTFSLWAMPGTGATIQLKNSDITEVGGQVIGMIRDAEGAAGNFIEVTATSVTYNFPGKEFSGAGSTRVLKDKKLASYNKEELWLAQGTGVEATIAKNNLQKVGGNITLKLKDEGDFYLTCGLEGTFDAAGGTGFTGGGAVTITREKELAKLGEYRFLLDKGAGAKAKIHQNKLTEVEGNVPFQVHDGKGKLIVGQAEGKYLAESKKFSGKGDVRLGRELTYEIGDIKLVFKEGSGGRGEVVDNELKKLGGTLDVDIHKGDDPIINVKADGEFDAVKKEIIYVEGTAKLLKSIDVGGEGESAILRITTLEGSARVEKNELKWCKGKLSFEAPRLLNMKGWVEGGWEATGGKDVFWGKGKVEFTIFDDPSKGRSMKGEVDFEYNKDETWKIKGEVDYQLNKMIGGKVSVECDQELDPIIGGELRVENVTLMEGRDLFKWNKEFALLNTTVWAGPVPIDINGGVLVGVGLSMLPLTFSTVIGFEGWRPVSAATKVPDFDVRADLNTGLRFAASLKPWFGLGLGVSGAAAAGVRLQGEVGVNVDVNVNPFAELKGRAGEYSGKLGIGVNVVGSGSLGITPQLYATLAKTWTYDLANITHDLGQLFSLEYNYAFPFGDQPAAPEKGGGGAAPPTAASGQTKKIQGHESKPAASAETSGSAKRPGAVEGGPDANKVDNQKEEESKQDDPMAEMMSKFDDVKEWGAKIGTLAKVGGHLVSMLTFMVTIPWPFGMAVAGLYLAYQLITGGLTFEEIVEACKTVWEIVGLIGEAVLSILPDWLTNLWAKIKGKTWDQLIVGLIDKMADWLIDLFPQATKLIKGLADIVGDTITKVANIISKIINGGFGFDDFIDLCRTFGGALAGLIAELVGDAIIEGAEEVGRAVYNFVTDPPW